LVSNIDYSADVTVDKDRFEWIENWLLIAFEKTIKIGG
jgi:hypothetical protein